MKERNINQLDPASVFVELCLEVKRVRSNFQIELKRINQYLSTGALAGKLVRNVGDIKLNHSMMIKVPYWMGVVAWSVLSLTLGHLLHLHVATFREFMDFAWDNVR